MSLLVIGISHKTAPVKVRERYSFTGKRIEGLLSTLKDSGLVSGAVVLSTCNRTEIYAEILRPFGPQNDKPHFEDLINVKEFMFGIFNARGVDRERYFYVFEEAGAVRHIFRVAAGLDSQVLGEGQILTQVRAAWDSARDMGTLSDELDDVFVTAWRMGKTIRKKTRISYGNVSIVSAALKMLEDTAGDMSGHSVLIIGAGKIGGLMSGYLKEKKIRGIFVASRTYPRAVELAASCGGRAVDFSRLEEELKGIDIVISSTSSPHIILKREMLARVMEARNNPLIIMDLAVPRDVDTAAKDIDGISLYDLDDLKCVVEESFRTREKAAIVAEGLIMNEVDNITGEVNIHV